MLHWVQRVREMLSVINVIKFEESCCITRIDDLLKTYNAKHLQGTNLNVFLKKTNLLTSMEPFKTPSKDTISLWIKNLLDASVIDTNVFKLNATCNASNSYVKFKCRLEISQKICKFLWKSCKGARLFNSIPSSC